METLKEELQKELNIIKGHIFFTQKLHSVKDHINDQALKEYIESIKLRKFDYKSVIISSYGFIEKFTNEIVKLYLTSLEKGMLKYSCLKKKK